MGFADAFATSSTQKAKPIERSKKPGNKGFASVFSDAPPEEIAKVQEEQNRQVESQVLKANADYANSVPGIARNMFDDLAAPFIEGYQGARSMVRPKSLDPRLAATAVTDAFGASLDDAGERVYNAASVLGDEHAGLLKKGVKVGEAALGVLGPIFTGLSAPLIYASSYPVIGPVADKVNELFAALGSGAGTYTTRALVDNLPVSDETKNEIRPLVHETAALAAQLYAGKYAGKAGVRAVKLVGEKGRGIMQAVSKDARVNPALQPSEISGTPLFHGANKETAALIRENGFRGSQDFPGSGMVSLTSNPAEARSYADLGGSRGEVMQVKLSGDNVKTYPSMEAYTKAIEKTPGKTAGAKEARLNEPYDAVIVKVPGQADVIFANPHRLELVNGGSKRLPVYGDTSLRRVPIEGEQSILQKDVPFQNKYTPDAELPVIPAGRVSRGTLPIVDLETPGSPRIPSRRYVPIEPDSRPVRAQGGFQSVFKDAPEAAPAPQRQRIAGEVEPPQINRIAAAERGELQPIGDGELVRSRLAANVEANAVERKLATSLGNLPEYKEVNMKEQADLASDLLANDPARATRIALGQELPPNHILPEAIFTAVENRAVKSGDVLTLRRLAQESTLSTEATAMGQRIRALAERDQESPVKILQDLNKSISESYEKRTKTNARKAEKQEVKQVQKEIKKATTNRQGWEEFVGQLTCNI